LDDLVPGDVVLTEAGPRVHTGAGWVTTSLLTESRRST
jgi:hypothetical protein